MHPASTAVVAIMIALVAGCGHEPATARVLPSSEITATSLASPSAQPSLTPGAPITGSRVGQLSPYPSADPVDAVFEAQSPGSADVTSSSDYTCFHTSPRCMRPTRLWAVHVLID